MERIPLFIFLTLVALGMFQTLKSKKETCELLLHLAANSFLKVI